MVRESLLEREKKTSHSGGGWVQQAWAVPRGLVTAYLC